MKRFTLPLLFIGFLFTNYIFGQEIIGTGQIKITVDNTDTGIKISSIKDSGTELLNTGTDLNLFTLFLTNLTTGTNEEIGALADWGFVEITATPNFCTITLSSSLNENIPIGLTATVTIETIGEKSEWDLSVEGLDDCTLNTANFPNFNIKADGDDQFLLPHFSGQIIENPVENELDKTLNYPRGWSASMQFFSYYNADNSIYFGFHDPTAAFKNFRILAEDGGVKLEGQFPIPNQTIAGNDWNFPGVFEMDLFAGDWFEAAMIYKDWVSTEAGYWPTESADRTARQQALGSIGLWSYYASPIDSPIETNQTYMTTFKDYFSGFPVGVHWYQWNNLPFDTDYPEYFPEMEGMADLVSDMQADGEMVIMPYLNGRLYATSLDDYLDNGYPHATKHADGTIYSQTFAGNLFAVMCPTEVAWQEILNEAALKLTSEIGTAGVYLDQVCAASPAPCMDPTHDHTLGGGSYWRSGYDEMFESIHTTIPANRFITVEGGCDYMADEVDGFLVEGWKANNMVPAFQAIYAGQLQLFGISTGTSQYHNQKYYCKTAQSFSFGVQPGRTSLFIVYDDDADISAPFQRQLGMMRYKMRDFMSFGYMLKPVPLAGEITDLTTTWYNFGVPVDVTISAVQSSVWHNNADTNKVAFIFVNSSMDETFDFSFDFNGADYGLTGPLTIQKITETVDGAIHDTTSVFTKNINLAPLEVAAYIISAGEPADIGIAEKEKEALQLYPNPAKNEIIVVADFATPYSIYTITGKKLKSGNLQKGQNSIDVRNLNSGTYIMQIENGSYKHFVIYE